MNSVYVRLLRKKFDRNIDVVVGVVVLVFVISVLLIVVNYRIVFGDDIVSSILCRKLCCVFVCGWGVLFVLLLVVLIGVSVLCVIFYVRNSSIVLLLIYMI